MGVGRGRPIARAAQEFGGGNLCGAGVETGAETDDAIVGIDEDGKVGGFIIVVVLLD